MWKPSMSPAFWRRYLTGVLMDKELRGRLDEAGVLVQEVDGERADYVLPVAAGEQGLEPGGVPADAALPGLGDGAALARELHLGEAEIPPLRENPRRVADAAAVGLVGVLDVARLLEPLAERDGGWRCPARRRASASEEAHSSVSRSVRLPTGKITMSSS